MNMEQKKINIGLIGLGARGTLLLHDVLLEHEDAVICAVCDVYEDRCEKAAQYIQEKTGQKPFQTTNYKEIFERKEVDAVLLCSSWDGVWQGSGMRGRRSLFHSGMLEACRDL